MSLCLLFSSLTKLASEFYDLDVTLDILCFSSLFTLFTTTVYFSLQAHVL